MIGKSSFSIHVIRRQRRILGPSLAATAALLSYSGLIGTVFGFQFHHHSCHTASFTTRAPHDDHIRPYVWRVPSVIRMVSFSDAKQVSAHPENKNVTHSVKDEEDWSDILPFVGGSHDSARISIPVNALEEKDNEEDPFNKDTFRERLQATVSACRELGKSSVWVEVPMAKSSLIEIGNMFALGFRFHHALDDRAVLNLWLREDESKIPEFSTHNVGVGAVVINSRNEILCVRELRRNYMPWKTPTGLSELGEHIDEAAEREVLEETGIRAKFSSVIGFRQTHGLAHGRSDLFFVCRLDPVEETDADGKPVIPEPIAQENEIEKAEWVPLDEYRAMVEGNNGAPGHPMMFHILHAIDAGRLIERKVVNSVIPGRAPNTIYYPVVKWDDSESQHLTMPEPKSKRTT